jgi:predicted RNA polymerase sigma factor
MKVPEAAEDPMDATTFADERLELIFTCCHPALAIDAQVALTLRTLGGLTTDEIARAFLGGRGPYVVQAAIASLHADEPRDWPQIAALYGGLARLTDSPVVELNRAVAIAEEQNPEAGLAIVDRLDLEHYRYLHATRGELLRRLGRTAEARDAYSRALALVHDDAERRLLERRLAELGHGAAPERPGDPG